MTNDIYDAAIEYCGGNKGSDARVRTAFVMGAEWQEEHLWKDAEGDDLPPIDKEVIVLLDNGKVCFGHRPVESYTGISITNYSEVEEYYPERYGKGGWNQPDIVWWLDLPLPYEGKEDKK